MSTGIHELLRRAAPHARGRLDVEALVRVAMRRRRRRQIGSTLGALVIIGGLVGGGVALAGDAGRSASPSVVADAPGTNPDAGVAVTLPAGWSDLPLANTGDPNQILVVGNVARPASPSINVCDTVTGSAYVSLYEFAPNLPFNLPISESGTLTRGAFQPRPADFTTAGFANSDMDCAAGPGGAVTAPSTTIPAPQPDHFIYYAFEDANRLFFAKVSSRADPSKQLLEQAIGVLNSLQVHSGNFLPPSATAPTTATTVVPVEPSTTPMTLPEATGPPPADQVSARQQIQATLTFAFRGGSTAQRQASVEGGYPLGVTTEKELARQNASLVGTLTVRINQLRFLDQTHAALNFDLLLKGQPVTATTVGEAIFDSGRWRITRATVCTIIDRGSIPCPA